LDVRWFIAAIASCRELLLHAQSVFLLTTIQHLASVAPYSWQHINRAKQRIGRKFMLVKLQPTFPCSTTSQAFESSDPVQKMGVYQ
jgi:hypothetical protein